MLSTKLLIYSFSIISFFLYNFSIETIELAIALASSKPKTFFSKVFLNKKIKSSINNF